MTRQIVPWTVLSSKRVFDSPWYKIRQDTVKLSNGTIINDYFVGELRDVAMVVPLTKQKELVFVRQYRHGVKKILLEFPAGTYDKRKEKAKTAAEREFLEETGYKTTQLVFLGELFEYPTKDSHSITIFLAPTIESVGKRGLEPTEEIEIVKVPIDKAISFVQQGKIQVSGTIAALFLALKHLKKFE